MNSSLRKGCRNLEKSDEQQKPEQSSYQSGCITLIVFSKQKRIKLMKSSMLQSDI